MFGAEPLISRREKAGFNFGALAIKIRVIMIQRWWFTPPVWGRLTSASGLIPRVYRIIANCSDQSAWRESCVIGRHFMSKKKKKKRKEEATWWELTLGAQWLLFSSHVPKGNNNPFRVYSVETVAQRKKEALLQRRNAVAEAPSAGPPQRFQK